MVTRWQIWSPCPAQLPVYVHLNPSSAPTHLPTPTPTHPHTASKGLTPLCIAPTLAAPPHTPTPTPTHPPTPTHLPTPTHPPTPTHLPTPTPTHPHTASKGFTPLCIVLTLAAPSHTPIPTPSHAHIPHTLVPGVSRQVLTSSGEPDVLGFFTGGFRQLQPVMPQRPTDVYKEIVYFVGEVRGWVGGWGGRAGGCASWWVGGRD
jgi:hypothetical protein